MKLKRRVATAMLWCSALWTILVMAGCANKKIAYNSIVRYQMVEIPCYGKPEYERLLTSEDEAVKYNAICNLIEYANDYARVLDFDISRASTTDEKAPTEEERENAKWVLETVIRNLDGRNENIKAVSLIFLTDFSSSYSNKEEMLGLVSHVKSEDARTLYEQIRALYVLSNAETRIDKDLIERFLDNRSWLIKSMTYLLLGNISCDEFHKRLIAEYNHTKEEYNRLLIIHAFGGGYGTESFDFIKTEMLSGASERIKNYIACCILNKNRDKKAVASWIIDDYKDIENEILKAILNAYFCELSSSIGTVFFSELLSSNQEDLTSMIDQEKFFKGLYESSKKQEAKNEFDRLELLVKNMDGMGLAWATYRENRFREEQKEQNKEKEIEKALPKYNMLLEKFLADSQKIFSEVGMDHDEIEETTKDIREFLRLINDKPLE